MKTKIFFGLALASITFCRVANASPIYVYKQPDGTIRFTSIPPKSGIKAQVFTAKSATVNYYRGEYVSFSPRPKGKSRLFLREYVDIIEKNAKDHRLDPSLVRAVIHVESAFNARAVSPKGAQGLMQLMPSTAKMMGAKRPFHPDENVAAGTKYLANLIKKYAGNLRLALAAYNAGPGAVEKYGGIPPYRETQVYVAKVLQMRSRYDGVS
jgi:soluble lytic murein transglycosylase-like protein